MTHQKFMCQPTRVLFLALALGAAAFLTGCSNTYIPPSGRGGSPSGKADFQAFTSQSMQESFAAQPAAGFPAGIATVRVQAPCYRNYYTEREGGVYGEGRYSVVTAKEVEDPADFERLAKLPQVGGMITLSTLLLPQQLQSDRELREAAARLKADMVLIYTFDTSFHENDAVVGLSVLTLGLSPTRRVYVSVAASALLIDTRTGFIYAALEANEKHQHTSNAWESGQSADRARRDAEGAAFKGLMSEFEKNWPRIVERAKKGA